VADYRRLLLQFPDDVGIVIGYLPNCLMSKDLGMSLRFFDGSRIIRPSGRERSVASLLENGGSAVPAGWQ